MFMLEKKVILCTILLMVLTIAIKGVTPCAATSESPEKVKVLTFLENVVGVDMETYETLNFKSLPEGIGETVIEYTVASESGNELHGLARFKDGKLIGCTLYALKGEPVLKVSYTEDLLNAARDFLRRCSVYSNASYCDRLTPLLDKIDVLGNYSSKSEEASLYINVNEKENRVSFEWNYRLNGIEAPSKKVGLSFEKGLMRGFIDTWGVTTIGSTTVSISEEEAKNIALNTAEEYINNLGASVTKITAKLDFYNDRHSGRGDRYTLYPRWSVFLTFDKQYGNVTGYHVSMWANTGEVFNADPQGSYGSTAPQGQLFDARIWMIMLLLPAALAVIAIVYRKRSSRPLKTYCRRRVSTAYPKRGEPKT